MPDHIDISPTTHIIAAMRSANFSVMRMISEMIDNSLDAGATRIDVSKVKTVWTFADNGSGISDFASAMRQGHHEPRSTKTIGMYGVGLKDAAIWAGNKMDISSSDGDLMRSGCVDWGVVERSGLWRIGAPTPCPATPEICAKAGVAHPHGTTIMFKGSNRKTRAWKDIVESISYHYANAIRSGVQITVVREKAKPAIVTPWSGPALDSVIEGQSSVRGMDFSYRAGVMKAGEVCSKFGYNIHFSNRVLTNTIEGTGAFNTSRFYCDVILDDGWKRYVGRNKDHVGNLAELCEALYPICKGVLEKAHAESMSFASSSRFLAVNQQLASACASYGTGNGKPKAPKKGKKGTIRDLGSRPTRDVGGKRRRPRRFSGNGVQITAEPAELDDATGWAVKVSGSKVHIALNSKREYFERWSSETMAVFAFTIASHHMGLAGSALQLFKHLEDMDAIDKATRLSDDLFRHHREDPR